ncbi:hypothetical protein ACI3EY_16685 [Ornithinimicrobium sp. LYQ92]|uniref:hypothetical protein n=1 Tax=Serinicoccus sp. LYQ92 TaxID=3378798 RepID=UPI00385219A0
MTDPIERAHLVATTRTRIRHQLETALDQIANHWHGAQNPPPAAASTGSKKPKPGSRLPMPLDPASAVDEAWRTLRSWGQLVMEERGVTVGPRTGHTPSCSRGCTEKHGPTGKQIAQWLALHAEWLSAHDAGEYAAHELARHGRRLRDIDLGYKSRRFQIGPCPEETITDEMGVTEACTGGLWALIREEDNMLPDRVVCDHNGDHTWSPSQWAALGRRMGNPSADEMHREMTRMAGHTSQETA